LVSQVGGQVFGPLIAASGLNSLYRRYGFPGLSLDKTQCHNTTRVADEFWTFNALCSRSKMHQSRRGLKSPKRRSLQTPADERSRDVILSPTRPARPSPGSISRSTNPLRLQIHGALTFAFKVRGPQSPSKHSPHGATILPPQSSFIGVL
jgi:hypothetical protein